MALGVPGRLRSRIFSTFGTTRVVGRQPNAPAAFTPRVIPGTHFQRLSRPQGTWYCRKEPWKKISNYTTGDRSRDHPTSSAAYTDTRSYKLLICVIFLTQKIAIPFVELEMFQLLQCFTFSYELLRFNIVFITDRHLTQFYDNSDHRRFSRYICTIAVLVNFSHIYLHLPNAFPFRTFQFEFLPIFLSPIITSRRP